MTVAVVEQAKCFIVLTNTAREAIKQHFRDEHALFQLQQYFIVYIEKLSIENEQIHLTFYFDPKENVKLTKHFPERVVIIDCLFDLRSGLVAKSFRTRGINTPVVTNRREKMHIHFAPTRINGHKYPPNFLQTLAKLPLSKERYDYVNKRIISWEGYLQVLNKNASVDDISAQISKPVFSADFTHLSIKLSQVESKQWSQLKGMAARVRGMHEDIGEVVKVQKADRTVEIELKPHIQSLVRRGELHIEHTQIEFSNAATKSQLQRLLKGFQRLKEGLAANPALETILFEDVPKLRPRKSLPPIEFHNQLNEFQKEAVIGALEAQDLYVIQGPPGTGKTTVISEICTQNVRMGLKTLVASQSNLAVDNALGRLLKNKDIRILRYGRTESIEEEGKKFIEENVATYWKEQTYNAVCQEIQQFDAKEQTLNDRLQVLAEKLVDCENSIETTKKQLLEKKEAQKELPTVKKDLMENDKKCDTIRNSIEEKKNRLKELEAEIEKLQAKLQLLKDQLKCFEDEEQIVKQLRSKKENADTLQHELDIAKLWMKQLEAENNLQQLKEQYSSQHSLKEEHAYALNELQTLKKVHEVEAFMQKYSVKPNFVINQLLYALEKLQEKYELVRNMPEDLIKRYQSAIQFCQQTLRLAVPNVYLSENVNYTLEECEQFLDKLKIAIKNYTIQQPSGYHLVEELHKRSLFLAKAKSQYDSVKVEAGHIFNNLKKEVILQFDDQEVSSTEKIESIQLNIQKQEQLITSLNNQLKNHPKESIRDQSIIREELQQIKSALEQLENLHDNMKRIQEEMTNANNELENAQRNHLNEEQQYIELNEKLKAALEKKTMFEKRYTDLEKIIRTNPEEKLQQLKSEMQAMGDEKAHIETELALLPMAGEIQKEWKKSLENATEYDLEEIRKLYVKHSNVIGTTCVASASKEFMDAYPTFDVVIIDEVSKATPPELLLPMLKGKKIILVGDHHQLPPLIGDDTFEETLEQVMKDTKSFEEKKELEKLLEESLFERLYKNVPKDHKKMLAIQYRMHENIMKTIAPFYKNAQEELRCGLTNSDEMRDHMLETSYFNRGHHLLWIDVPNSPEHYEQRMKEGSSLYNETELKEIEKMLVEMNDATKRAIEEGLMAEGKLKSIGVISYYAEQVKHINRMLEVLNLPHLNIRTGSVDKFQGMEMDVIIVSMVRNHTGDGGIGFAKDYRRLNVALSRARELLICIGSTKMFTELPKKKETKEMYMHVLNVVKAQDGYRLLGGAKE